MSDCPKGRTPGPVNNAHLATAYAYGAPSSQAEAGAHFLTILMVYDLESRYANISISFLTEEYHDCLTIDFGATANMAGR
eukprot:16129433-Heterocapsa_arctica.AAC.1